MLMLDTIDTTKKNRFRPTINFGMKVLVVFGTRPEAIKLAPVIKVLRERMFQTVVVCTSQHKQLLAPFLKQLKIEVDFDLSVMRKDQSPSEVCSRILAKLDKIISNEKPDLILVQGDTTTTLAGALAAFYRQVPVGHIEAGLRSGDQMSPFPEEMNRRVVSQIARFHFAATEKNRRNLLSEDVPSDRIHVTGNPVVDALKSMLKELKPSDKTAELLKITAGKKRLLLTTHRRESFGGMMLKNLKVLREFIEKHPDTCLLFPVHPNPNVRLAADAAFAKCERVHLLEPLDYSDFLHIMRSSWLIVSDSGGVQEEAPSLGKPLLVLRENTERPEAIRAGVAKLVGARPGSLKRLLDENYSVDTWIRSVKEVSNPFGDGQSAKRIVRIIEEQLATRPFVAGQATLF